MTTLTCKSCGADAIVTYSCPAPQDLRVPCGFRPGCAHYPGCEMKGHKVERETHLTTFDAIDAWQAIHQPTKDNPS